MADHGNPTQWGNTYPPKSLIEQDIRDGVSYVCEEAGQLLAVFFYKKGRDDTYAKIYEGQWLNEDPYGVVHRMRFFLPELGAYTVRQFKNRYPPG